MAHSEARVEHLREEIHHHSATSQHRWVMGVALSSALVAALAAVASMQAGHHINKAVLSQLRSAEQWAYFQSRVLNTGVLQTKIDLLEALGKPVNAADKANIEKYTAQQDEIKKKAKELDVASSDYLEHHEHLSTAETLFQVSIAIAAISVLTQIRKFWWASLGFALIGCYFMAIGFFVK